MEKLKLTLTFGIITGAIVMGFYLLSRHAEKEKSDRIIAMSHGYKYSKGIILKKNSYKGRTIEIRFQINGAYYTSTRNWSTNPKNIGVGDSISFKYAISNPKFIITELEDNY